jgi:hypothetical protein
VRESRRELEHLKATVRARTGDAEGHRVVATASLHQGVIQEDSATRKAVRLAGEIVQAVALELEVARLPRAAKAVLLALLLLEPAGLLWGQVRRWVRDAVVVCRGELSLQRCVLRRA